MVTEAKKKRVFQIIQIGSREDLPSRGFDILIMVMILLNLFIAIFETFDSSAKYQSFLDVLELITVLVFTMEYALRLWTSEFLYPDGSRHRAVIRYIFSVGGVVDLLSFLPYYLPFFFPAGVVAFRMFRVVRILRLFQLNAYYDALNVITVVIKSKKDQLLSSVFIILVLMTAASLCMYSLEHEAQPELFRNAFSGFWWSVSTLLTVGYGDIYPITVAGRVFGILITFLGVGMVAIPTGILSAGFVEYYSRLQHLNGIKTNETVILNCMNVTRQHPWCGKKLGNLELPESVTIMVVKRKNSIQSPIPSYILKEGDQVFLYDKENQDALGS